MNREVFITCAVTAPAVAGPIAARAAQPGADRGRATGGGAAVVHCHVRDPDTGAPSRRVTVSRAHERIRESDTDVVLNLTTGMGGDLVFGSVEAPLPPDPAGTDMAGATERMEPIRACLPESARSIER